jgi:hypothetical protein
VTKEGIHNPLGLARLCASLEGELKEAGFTVDVGHDFRFFDDLKKQLRGERVGPMHDAELCDFSHERAFWMCLVDKDGQTVGTQAYRCDTIETSLADWLPNYMIGVYMRRQELMVPSHPKPPHGSVSWQLRGSLVYEGELWISKTIKGRRVFDHFTRFGLLLCTIKWNPDAIWGLAGDQMARHGHVGRIGYSILEKGFLRWQMASKNIDAVEYLAVIDKAAITQLIEEMQITAAEYLPEPPH